MSCCRTGTKSALSVEMEPLRSANDVGVLAPRPAISGKLLWCPDKSRIVGAGLAQVHQRSRIVEAR